VVCAVLSTVGEALVAAAAVALWSVPASATWACSSAPPPVTRRIGTTTSATSATTAPSATRRRRQ
jgi:hypothetical protein